MVANFLATQWAISSNGIVVGAGSASICLATGLLLWRGGLSAGYLQPRGFESQWWFMRQYWQLFPEYEFAFLWVKKFAVWLELYWILSLIHYIHYQLLTNTAGTGSVHRKAWKAPVARGFAVPLAPFADAGQTRETVSVPVAAMFLPYWRMADLTAPGKYDPIEEGPIRTDYFFSKALIVVVILFPTENNNTILCLSNITKSKVIIYI